jgi:hypothetical protein
MKQSPAGAGAAAVILYHEVFTDDDKKFETHYMRIKVFTEEGKKYGDVEIPYFEKRVQVEDIRARTVRPDGTSLEFEGQVYDKVVAKARGVKLQMKAFSLPEVRPGNIIEYSYRLRWNSGLPDVVKHPGNYLIPGVIAVPTAHWDIQSHLFTRRARFTLHPAPSQGVQFTWMHIPGGVRPQRQPDGSVQLDLENISAFEEEEYMPPESALTGRVDFYYMIGYAPTMEVFWASVAKRRAENSDAFIGQRKGIQRAAAATVDPNDPPETKLRKLYARVQQIRNLSYERRRMEVEEKREKLKDNENVEDVLNRGYGRGNEINLLFVALARALGFEAWAVEVSSRSSTFFVQDLPDTGQLNAMVVAVQLGDRKIFLDPATRLCPYGLVPWEETGTKGILLRSFGGSLIETPQLKSNEAVIERKASLRLDASGALEGTVQISYRGQEALDRRRGEFNEDEAGRKKDLEEGFKSLLPSGVTVELVKATGWESNEAPLVVEYKVRVPDAAESVGRRLVLTLALFHADRTFSFQHADRKHPIYFRYPFQELDEITVQLPEGYEVESLPDARHAEKSFGRFDISAERLAGAVRLKRRYIRDEYLFPVESYGLLRSFFNSVQAGDEEPTVLRKIQK